MKLWLDDNRDPKDPEIQELFGSDGDEIWCKTTKQAAEYLLTGKVVSISLDHDLQTRQTGYDLAKWIERRAYAGQIPKLTWFVHSKNSEGANNIRRALSNADNYWNKEIKNG